jgi:hypothetical protein
MLQVVKQEMFEGKERKITLDPVEYYKDANPVRLVDACGVLLAWGFEAVINADPVEVLDNYYQFGLTSITGGSITENGCYNFPGDPTLYPIASITYGTTAMYIYQYAIVAVVVTRMN